ncbi:MAG: hypothetical protein J6Y82_09780 [Bacteroidales bacterium]|nr:hypothetical protein [Bacteroidales bacterium]
MTSKHHFSIGKMLASVVVVAALCASCGEDKNVQRFKDAAMQLDNTTHTLTSEFDYWPECGIRVTGSHLASLISLSELEQMVPSPLYVSGPHKNGQWDLNNESEFGHYNPKAIQYLADLAKQAVSDKVFVQATKPLIDQYLGRQMKILMVLHDALYDENMYDKEGRETVLEDALSSEGYCWLLNSINLDDDSYVYGNTGNQFVYFWARRYADGTIDQFYDGLSAIYKAYYPEYVYDLNDYYNEYYGDGDYYEEEYESDYDFDFESCQVAENEKINESSAVSMIKDAISDLDNSYNVFRYEGDGWPDGNLRNIGAHLFSRLCLSKLNAMLPCELYVSGPHSADRWYLYSEDFGHYNPEAIKYLNGLIKKVVSDKSFVQKTKPIVDKYLKAQMTIMKDLYEALNDKSKCSNKQAFLDETMKNYGGGGFYSDGETGEFYRSIEYFQNENNPLVYEGGLFMYFWARRNVDGTMDLFYEGLKTIYDAYYK